MLSGSTTSSLNRTITQRALDLYEEEKVQEEDSQLEEKERQEFLAIEASPSAHHSKEQSKDQYHFQAVPEEKEQEEGKESEKRHTRALAFSPSLQNGFEIIRNGHNMNTDSDGSR